MLKQHPIVHCLGWQKWNCQHIQSSWILIDFYYIVYVWWLFIVPRELLLSHSSCSGIENTIHTRREMLLWWQPPVQSEVVTVTNLLFQLLWHHDTSWHCKSLALWLFNSLFRQKRKYQSTTLLALCVGKPLVVSGFTPHKASNSECHHVMTSSCFGSWFWFNFASIVCSGSCRFMSNYHTSLGYLCRYSVVPL